MFWDASIILHEIMNLQSFEFDISDAIATNVTYTDFSPYSCLFYRDTTFSKVCDTLNHFSWSYEVLSY